MALCGAAIFRNGERFSWWLVASHYQAAVRFLPFVFTLPRLSCSAATRSITLLLAGLGAAAGAFLAFCFRLNQLLDLFGVSVLVFCRIELTGHSFDQFRGQGYLAW